MIQKPVEPTPIIQKVEAYVEDQYRDVAKFENREHLDESAIYSLHLLAGDIYQTAFNDGIQAERARCDGEIRRAREAQRKAGEQ